MDEQQEVTDGLAGGLWPWRRESVEPSVGPGPRSGASSRVVRMLSHKVSELFGHVLWGSGARYLRLTGDGEGRRILELTVVDERQERPADDLGTQWRGGVSALSDLLAAGKD